MLLTAGQVCELLEISKSTLRNWRDAWLEHLSDSAKKKRGRRYTPEDIEILKRGKLLLSRGFTMRTANDNMLVQDDRQEVTLQRLDEFAEFRESYNELMTNLAVELSYYRSQYEELLERVAELEKPFWKRKRKKR